MPPAGLWSDKTAEDSGCGCLRRGPAVSVDLTALGSGRPGPPGGFRASRFRTRPSGLMAGGPRFFDPQPRPSVANEAGFLVLFRFWSFFEASSPCRLLSGCRRNLWVTGTPVPRPTLPHHAIAPFGHATHPPGTAKPRSTTANLTVDLRPLAPQTAFIRQPGSYFPTRFQRFNRHHRKPKKPIFLRVFLGLGSHGRTFVQLFSSFLITLFLLFLLFPLLSFFYP